MPVWLLHMPESYWEYRYMSSCHKTTSKRAIDWLQLEKAQVIVHGESWQEANRHALSLIGDNDAYIHPFDDPLVWREAFYYGR